MYEASCFEYERTNETNALTPWNAPDLGCENFELGFELG
jgi:hypothetical protein